MVTINHVKVAKDLGYADVYITVLPLGEQDEAEATKQSLEVLKQAAGFLRAELAKGISLRVMPALRFHYDESIHRGRHLTSLIEKARRLEDNEG
jgi:ribosome-binding factor A